MAHMDKKTRKKLLEDVLDILEVEELGHILLHKITELKILASIGIDNYKSETRTRRKLSSILSGNFPGTDFELHRIGEKLWIPSIRGANSISNIFEIISMEILNYIGERIEDDETIFMGRGIRFVGQPDKLFDLAFEKDSSHHIRGIINIYEDKTPGIPAVNEPKESPGNEIFEDMDETELLKLMFEYLIAHRDFFTFMSNEFIICWKPYLDENLRITAKK